VPSRRPSLSDDVTRNATFFNQLIPSFNCLTDLASNPGDYRVWWYLLSGDPWRPNRHYVSSRVSICDRVAIRVAKGQTAVLLHPSPVPQDSDVFASTKRTQETSVAGVLSVIEDVSTTIAKTRKGVGVVPVLNPHCVICEPQKLSNLSASHAGQKGSDKFHFLLVP
jgi:hypothetical protein